MTCDFGNSVVAKEVQITCLYDMDIPRPDSFNETYLYEGADQDESITWISNLEQSSWSVIWLLSSARVNRLQMRISNRSSIKSCVVSNIYIRPTSFTEI